MKEILFTISNGWGIRNYVHTGIIANLTQDYLISIVTTDELYPALLRSCPPNVRILPWRLQTREPKDHHYWRLLQKFTLIYSHNISTQLIKDACRWRGRTYHPGYVIYRLISSIVPKWANNLLNRLYPLVRNLPKYGVIFDQCNPDLVVNLSPFDFRDTLVSKWAHQSRVPSLGVLPSWDNITSKGILAPVYDRIIVWGSLQRNDISRFYTNFPSSSVAVLGTPQFDVHSRQVPPITRESFCSSLSIDPHTSIILYATCSSVLFPEEPEIVADIADDLHKCGELRNCTLLVRCHPRDDLRRYDALRGRPRVVIWAPIQTESLYAWDPADDDMNWLSSGLRHAAVCINTASTITLDAMACKCPTINVAYDGSVPKPSWNSVCRYYRYSHYQPISLSGLIPQAKSHQELLDLIISLKDQGTANPSAVHDLAQTIAYTPPEGAAKAFIQYIRAVLC